MTNWIKIAIISHNNLAIKAFLICFIWFVRQWRTNKRKSEKKKIVIIIWNFSKYDSFSIHFNSCHFHHRIYHELTMACSPVGLISSVDRSLRPIIAKVRVPLGFPLKPEFFRFIFNRSGCSLYCESRSSSLSYLYPQFKIWFTSYISIHNNNNNE